MSVFESQCVCKLQSSHTLLCGKQVCEHLRQTRSNPPVFKPSTLFYIYTSIYVYIYKIKYLVFLPLMKQKLISVYLSFTHSEGSNLTPAHHNGDFRFKTYAPIAFRYFRELFGIRPDDYLVSWTTHTITQVPTAVFLNWEGPSTRPWGVPNNIK